MDANSEYYPGGEVISQILQAYGSSDIYGSSRYIDRNGYGRSHPRTRIVNNLNNAYYDSDSSTIDRNYDYIDNTVRYLLNTQYFTLILRFINVKRLNFDKYRQTVFIVWVLFLIYIFCMQATNSNKLILFVSCDKY